MPARERRGNLGRKSRSIGVPGLLQFSDPHLLADPGGYCRGRPSMTALVHGLRQALVQIDRRPDLLLITGDLCQDESWGGYRRLLDALDQFEALQQVPLALTPGNHDHLALLRAALGRRAVIAPAALDCGGWTLLLLSTHRSGCVAGSLDPRQLAWLERQLAAARQPVVLALHHPPVPIGDPGLDPIALQDSGPLLQCLQQAPVLKAVLFGHVHQHWQGELPRAGGGPPIPLWACPSSLAPFAAVQPCPLGHSDWPGGRWLTLQDSGEVVSTLLRWSPLESA